MFLNSIYFNDLEIKLHLMKKEHFQLNSIFEVSLEKDIKMYLFEV